MARLGVLFYKHSLEEDIAIGWDAREGQPTSGSGRTWVETKRGSILSNFNQKRCFISIPDVDSNQKDSGEKKH